LVRANCHGSKVSQGVNDALWLMSMQAGAVKAYESIKAFSATDFTNDLNGIDNTEGLSGAPHGPTVIHTDRLNSDLLSFLKA
jgi:hypothetical protein